MTSLVSGSTVWTLLIPYGPTLEQMQTDICQTLLEDRRPKTIGNELLIAVFSFMNVMFVRSVSNVDAFMIASPANEKKDIVFSWF